MDSSTERIALLRETEFFRQATPEILADLAARCDDVSLAARETLFRQGDRGDALYIVRSGVLEIFVGDALMDRSGPGSCIGEIALVADQPRFASVRAQNDVKLLRLSREAFAVVLARYHEVLVWGVFRELANKVKSSIRVRVEQHDQNRRLKDAFAQSVSQAVMEEIIASKDPAALLDGKETVATVLFADIRSFTTISESMEPPEVIRYLNVYLGPLVDLVLDAGGTLDKFLGDGVMAYFGVPLSTGDDAERAVRCALAMLTKLVEINAGASVRAPVPCRIGLGLATGSVVAGCVGTARRMEYTVMGDVVNTASRIEGVTKIYGSELLLAAETADAVKLTMTVRRVDTVRVKGKKGTTALFDVVAPRRGDAEAEARVARYDAAFAEYAAGRFARAREMFASLGDGPSAALAARCVEMAAHAPPEGWDGIYELKSK